MALGRTVYVHHFGGHGLSLPKYCVIQSVGMMLKAGVLCSQEEQTLQGMNCLTQPVLVNTFKYIN